MCYCSIVKNEGQVLTPPKKSRYQFDAAFLCEKRRADNGAGMGEAVL